jgi:hypothetical protein
MRAQVGPQKPGERLRLQQSQKRPSRLAWVNRNLRTSISCLRSANALRRVVTWRLWAFIMRLVVDMVCCAEYLYARLLYVNVECVMFYRNLHFEGEF